MIDTLSEFFSEYGNLFIEGTRDSLLMIFISTFFSYVIGLPLGVLVTITATDSIISPSKIKVIVNAVLGWIVNIGRSMPFIILMVALMPFTRNIVGTATGVKGAIIPLVIAAAPFVARLVESSLMEIDEGLIEVAHATGSTVPQIVFKVLLPEGRPSILMGVPITLITLFGYSAMAGVVGAGGLGDIALRYGFYRYQDDVMIFTIILLVILVQCVQSVGTFIVRKSDRRIRR